MMFNFLVRDIFSDVCILIQYVSTLIHFHPEVFTEEFCPCSQVKVYESISMHAICKDLDLLTLMVNSPQ